MALMRDYVGRANFTAKASFTSKILPICTLCVGILFKCTALGIHSCQTLQLYILIGGEIYSSDVNTHKGYSLICLKKIP